MRILITLILSLFLSTWSIDAWAGLPPPADPAYGGGGTTGPGGGAGGVYEGVCEGSGVCDPPRGAGGDARLGGVAVASNDPNLTFSASQISRLGGVGLNSVPINLWVNGGVVSVDYDRPGAQYDGYRSLVMFGADVKILNDLTLGIAGSYEDVDLDTSFNWGGNDKSGLGVNPYAFLTLNKLIKLGLTGGYSFFSNDYKSRASANGAPVVGGADSERWHVAPSVILNQAISKLQLFSQLSYLYASESVDSYTNSASRFIPSDDYYFGQIRLRVRAS